MTDWESTISTSIFNPCICFYFLFDKIIWFWTLICCTIYEPVSVQLLHCQWGRFPLYLASCSCNYKVSWFKIVLLLPHNLPVVFQIFLPLPHLCANNIIQFATIALEEANHTPLSPYKLFLLVDWLPVTNNFALIRCA